MIPPGIEPGPFRVWSERDNRYTTESIHNTNMFFRAYCFKINFIIN